MAGIPDHLKNFFHNWNTYHNIFSRQNGWSPRGSSGKKPLEIRPHPSGSGFPGQSEHAVAPLSQTWQANAALNGPGALPGNNIIARNEKGEPIYQGGVVRDRRGRVLYSPPRQSGGGAPYALPVGFAHWAKAFPGSLLANAVNNSPTAARVAQQIPNARGPGGIAGMHGQADPFAMGEMYRIRSKHIG